MAFGRCWRPWGDAGARVGVVLPLAGEGVDVDVGGVSGVRGDGVSAFSFAVLVSVAIASVGVGGDGWVLVLLLMSMVVGLGWRYFCPWWLVSAACSVPAAVGLAT